MAGLQCFVLCREFEVNGVGLRPAMKDQVQKAEQEIQQRKSAAKQARAAKVRVSFDNPFAWLCDVCSRPSTSCACVTRFCEVFTESKDPCIFHAPGWTRPRGLVSHLGVVVSAQCLRGMTAALLPQAAGTRAETEGQEAAGESSPGEQTADSPEAAT